jgi:hypothetical protein
MELRKNEMTTRWKWDWGTNKVENSQIIIQIKLMSTWKEFCDDEELHWEKLATHLNWNQSAANDQLRLGRDEGRPLRRLLARLENPRDAIRFCQQCCINYSEAEASTESEWESRNHEKTSDGR